MSTCAVATARPYTCETAFAQRSRIRAASGNDSCNEPRATGLLRLLSDENFDNYIVRGLMRGLPTIDLIRVVDRRQAGIGRPPKGLVTMPGRDKADSRPQDLHATRRETVSMGCG